MTVAFVLQGGASLAAVQVGMLRALTEADIRPDLVVGCSAGALNAVAFAQDPTLAGLENLQRLWLRVRRGDVLPLRPLSLTVGIAGLRDSIAAPDRLSLLIQHGLRISDLRDTAVPAHVVATDVYTGMPVVLSHGSALTALLASSSIPGVLPPVPWEGRSLVDGSQSADIPIKQAESLGAMTSYVLPSLLAVRPQASPVGVLPILIRTLGTMVGRIAAGELAAAQRNVHVLPTPEVYRALNPLSFRHTAELIQRGYDTTRVWLAKHSTSSRAATSSGGGNAAPPAAASLPAAALSAPPPGELAKPGDTPRAAQGLNCRPVADSRRDRLSTPPVAGPGVTFPEGVTDA
ncbi:patatin-like phospholipase family protein [Streptomyces aurantiacus]|uniref:patatin-like phospholipase family protein n=1 Tax=Streptomyces aurantiacus TaxID=47760 RepID=UPI000998BB20|nr:patatin-like phospholipase family protein [Streptomyces aurantiacus]